MENLLHPLRTIASSPLALHRNRACCKHFAVIEETRDSPGLLAETNEAWMFVHMRARLIYMKAATIGVLR
jgi:hypothetical protein